MLRESLDAQVLSYRRTSGQQRPRIALDLHGHGARTPNQLGDAAGIWAVQGPDLDRVYLQRRARELGVSRTSEEIESGRIRVKGT